MFMNCKKILFDLCSSHYNKKRGHLSKLATQKCYSEISSVILSEAKDLHAMKINKPFSAFTLIELLIVISIIGVLTATTMPSLLGFTNVKGLEREAVYILSDINLARNKALSNAFDDGGNSDVTDDSNHWGIRFLCSDPKNTYELGYFYGVNSWVAKQTKMFHPDFSFECSSGDIDLKFERGTGELTNPSDSTLSSIKILYKNSISKYIKVYVNGKTEVTD